MYSEQGYCKPRQNNVFEPTAIPLGSASKTFF